MGELTSWTAFLAIFSSVLVKKKIVEKEVMDERSKEHKKKIVLLLFGL